jgi:hypothetical protein
MHLVLVSLVALLFLTSCGHREPGGSAAPTPAPAAAENPAVAPADSSAVLSELTQAVRRYAAEQRKAPTSLDELVTEHYLPAIPQAPAGKRFAIDKKLQVYLADQ